MTELLSSVLSVGLELRRTDGFPAAAVQLARLLEGVGAPLERVSVFLHEAPGVVHYFLHPGPAGWESVAVDPGSVEARARAAATDMLVEGTTWRLAVPVSLAVVSITGATSTLSEAQRQQLVELAPALVLFCLRHHDVLEHAALASRVTQTDESIMALYDGSYDLSGADRQQVASRIIDLVRSTLQLDRVGLFLRQGEVLRGAWGMNDDRHIVSIASTVFPLDPQEETGLSEAAMIARGELAYFLTQDLDAEGRQSIEGNIHANVSVPMRVGKRIIGVLAADTYYDPRPIDPEIVRPLMVLANQGAAALENARLYAELHVARDDLERRVAERTQELTQANADKELLLKEVYHRTKNNLQLVVSMLNLQVGHVADEQAVKALEDCAQRIYAMSTIHEELYSASDLRAIDFARHLHTLLSGLFRSYQVQPGAIKLVLDADYLLLGLDAAIPLSLIVNELGTNSLKYAFPAGRQGTLEIHMRIRGDDVDLRVCDDGVGLPDGVEPTATTTLALQLVTALCQQIGGTLSVITRPPGVAFHFTFPGLAAQPQDSPPQPE